MLESYYFNFGAPEREGRNAFTCIMTRNSYTKSATFKEMLPEDRLTLVDEREASMARVVPHIFRDEIPADRSECHVANFDKDAKNPQIVPHQCVRRFLPGRDANPKLTVPDALHARTWIQLKAAMKDATKGAPEPFPGSNFGSKAFSALWIRRPIQASGETNKAIGFPILSPRYRAAYRKLGFQDPITDPDLLVILPMVRGMRT